MPKLKSPKSAVKRLWRTGSGKAVARKTSVTHFGRRKSKRTHKNQSKLVTVISAIAKKLVRVGI